MSLKTESTCRIYKIKASTRCKIRWLSSEKALKDLKKISYTEGLIFHMTYFFFRNEEQARLRVLGRL